MDVKKIKHNLKEYLSFSKSEKVGILVLICLISVIIGISIIVPRLLPARSSIDITKFNKEIADFEKSSDSLRNHDSVRDYKSNSYQSKKKGFVKEPVKIQVDLNLADSASLEQLRGIGPVLAKRILKYRLLLGGYYSLNQLYEVYGIKPEVADEINKQLVIDTTRITKMNLNIADFKTINAHPYISFEQTKAIFKYKKTNKIISIKQLQELNIFTSEELLKLRPYLRFSE